MMIGSGTPNSHKRTSSKAHVDQLRVNVETIRQFLVVFLGRALTFDMMRRNKFQRDVLPQVSLAASRIRRTAQPRSVLSFAGEP